MTSADGPLAGLEPGFTMSDDERELVRSLILADPELVLGDDQVMRAVIGEAETPSRKVVDLRDRLVMRLEDRLKRLVSTHRSVVAAAYENVAGTQQVHRAIVALIATRTLGEFMSVLTGDLPGLFGIDEVRVLFDSEVDAPLPLDALADGFGEALIALPTGTLDVYAAIDGQAPERPVILRGAGPDAELIFGPDTVIRSEAILRLRLDDGFGCLAFGSADPDHFHPSQGTDLLTFLGEAVGLLLGRHLSVLDGA